jgi:hypothetical protein
MCMAKGAGVFDRLHRRGAEAQRAARRAAATRR